MFNLFKKRVRGMSPVLPLWQKLGDALRVRLHKWAASLQVRASKYSLRTQKYGLFFFSAVFGLACLYITWDAMQYHPPAKHIDSITIPRHVTGGSKKDSLAQWQTSPEYMSIQRFKNYLLELDKTPGGKRTHDSIVRARPGLMDSIQQLENIYQQH